MNYFMKSIKLNKRYFILLRQLILYLNQGKLALLSMQFVNSTNFKQKIMNPKTNQTTIKETNFQHKFISQLFILYSSFVIKQSSDQILSQIEITFHFITKQNPMKRISIDSLTTSLQIPSHLNSSYSKPFINKENRLHPKETAIQNQTKTEPFAFSNFSHTLFAECFPKTQIEITPKRTYHKLQYHSLDKKQNKSQQMMMNLEKKTLSLKDSFLSFGNQSIKHQNNGQTTRSLNQCTIADIVGSQQKYNVLDDCQNTGRSSVMVSTMNSANGLYSKYQNCVNGKMFLSQDVKLLNTRSPVQSFKKVPLEKGSNQRKGVSDDCFDAFKTRRLSTNDSMKIKQNLQTEQSQTMSPLQIGSILCESIRINQQDRQNLNLFEFDHMKDSLIDKLKLFRKQDSFAIPKKRSFIRSGKHQKQTKQSPRFCNEEPILRKRLQTNQQNQQDFIQKNKIQSCETVERKIVSNKFNSLDQCGYTIVSRYNKSSDQKSILDQSNIVFQASKMCQEPVNLNDKLPKFSDSSIIFNKQLKQDDQNQKQYNSFIYELKLAQHGEQKTRNSNYVNKKANRAFLRSKKSSSEKEIKSKDNQEMDIRFDLDTFIEYGPL